MKVLGLLWYNLKRINMTTQTEVWKPVKGFEEGYEVSNFGRVMRIARTMVLSSGRTHSIKAKECNRYPTPNGKWRVSFKSKSKSKSVLVERLVWDAFGGAKVKEGYEIAHRNNDTTDNTFWNLEIRKVVGRGRPKNKKDED